MKKEVIDQLKELVREKFNEDLGYDGVSSLLTQALQRRTMKPIVDLILNSTSEEEHIELINFCDAENKKEQLAKQLHNFDLALLNKDFEQAQQVFNNLLPKYTSDLKEQAEKFEKAASEGTTRTWHVVEHIQHKRPVIMSSKQHKSYQDQLKAYLAEQSKAQ